MFWHDRGAVAGACLPSPVGRLAQVLHSYHQQAQGAQGRCTIIFEVLYYYLFSIHATESLPSLRQK